MKDLIAFHEARAAFLGFCATVQGRLKDEVDLAQLSRLEHLSSIHLQVKWMLAAVAREEAEFGTKSPLSAVLERLMTLTNEAMGAALQESRRRRVAIISAPDDASSQEKATSTPRARRRKACGRVA